MGRRAARVDENQSEIVEALRAAGASVQSLAATGKGVPDLLVGYFGCNFLLEVKDGDKVPSKRKLTPDQVEWHDKWNGRVAVVKNVKEAMKAIQVQWTGETWTHCYPVTDCTLSDSLDSISTEL